MQQKIKLTIVGKLGPDECRRGHRVGDSFDYETERGKICPIAMHTLFPIVDIMRYGGKLPAAKTGKSGFCCPDADVALVFNIDVVEE